MAADSASLQSQQLLEQTLSDLRSQLASLQEEARRQRDLSEQTLQSVRSQHALETGRLRAELEGVQRERALERQAAEEELQRMRANLKGRGADKWTSTDAKEGEENGGGEAAGQRHLE